MSGWKFLTDDELAQVKATHPEITEDCPTCRDGEYTWQGTTKLCDCATQKRLNRLYSHAGIGQRYQRLGWNDLKVPEAQLAPIRKYLANAENYIASGIGLYISGDVGTGKTLVSNLILKDLVMAGHDCYFTTFSGAIEQFTSTWGDRDEKTRFAKRFMLSKVLCLDDLGKEFRNRLSSTTFDHILRTRVFEARPTILTTNLHPTEISVGYGAPILSLLAEQSIHVHFTGGDYRPHAHYRSISEVEAGEVRAIV